MLAARNGDVPTITVLINNGADRMATCKLTWAENRTAEGLAELEKTACCGRIFQIARQKEGLTIRCTRSRGPRGREMECRSPRPGERGRSSNEAHDVAQCLSPNIHFNISASRTAHG